MRTFYEQHYSANLMRLVVVGRQSLDELERLVAEKFSAVPNRQLSALHPPGQHPATFTPVPPSALYAMALPHVVYPASGANSPSRCMTSGKLNK